MSEDVVRQESVCLSKVLMNSYCTSLNSFNFQPKRLTNNWYCQSTKILIGLLCVWYGDCFHPTKKKKKEFDKTKVVLRKLWRRGHTCMTKWNDNKSMEVVDGWHYLNICPALSVCPTCMFVWHVCVSNLSTGLTLE